MYCIQIQNVIQLHTPHTDSRQHLHTYPTYIYKLTQVYIRPKRAYLEQIYTSPIHFV